MCWHVDRENRRSDMSLPRQDPPGALITDLNLLFVLEKVNYSLQSNSLHPIISNQLSSMSGKTFSGSFCTSEYIRTDLYQPSERPSSPPGKVGARERTQCRCQEKKHTPSGHSNQEQLLSRSQNKWPIATVASSFYKLLLSTHYVQGKVSEASLDNKMWPSHGVCLCICMCVGGGRGTGL